MVPIQGTFVTEGTTPKGSMWSRIPIPSDCLGPRCIPGPNDTDATPHRCLPGETHLIDGPCEACPGHHASRANPTRPCPALDGPSSPPGQSLCGSSMASPFASPESCLNLACLAGTPGSDCSRCDNNCQSGQPAFEPHCPHCQGNRHDIAVRDMVKVPSHLPPGRYVLGFRYDCEATAQVWNSCSDITLV